MRHSCGAGSMSRIPCLTNPPELPRPANWPRLEALLSSAVCARQGGADPGAVFNRTVEGGGQPVNLPRCEQHIESVQAPRLPFCE